MAYVPERGRFNLGPWLAVLLLLVLLTFPGRTKGAAGVLVQLTVDSTSATVNGTARTLDVPAQIQDGRTLVPLRFVGEALGATIGWDGDQRMVTYTLGSVQINLWIDDTHARVSGQDITLDVPPRIAGGRTLVPVRFIGEQLGAVVGWEAAARTVWIGLGDVPNLVLEQDFAFSRTGFSVPAGQPIIFINRDQVMHTVSGTAIDSGDLAKGEAFVLRNLPAGTYAVHCAHHRSMQAGFTVTTGA